MLGSGPWLGAEETLLSKAASLRKSQLPRLRWDANHVVNTVTRLPGLESSELAVIFCLVSNYSHAFNNIYRDE